MNRVSVFVALPLNSFGFSWRDVGFVTLGALLMAAAPPQTPVHAITINMTYTDEGSTPPHPENPTWDPAGVILKDHFQAAKTIWESLLPGGGSYSFDFHWDNNIDGLGLTTLSGADDFIEINPDFDWFADPDPTDDVEFNAGGQTLYGSLSASDQTTYFPGAAPPGALETGYSATGLINGTFVNGVPVNTLSASGQVLPGTATPVDASNGYDLLSTILHEVGHVLGINGEEPGNYNIYPQHVGGLTNVLVLEGGGGHLGGGPVPPPVTNIVPGFLMCNSCAVPGLRRFATATDVLVIAEDQGITVVQLARVGRISSGLWSDATAWIAGDVPDATQDVYVSHGGTVTLDADQQARNLTIFSGANSVAVLNHQLRTNGTLIFDGAALSVDSGGTIAANSIIGDTSALTTTAGSLVRFNQFTRGPSSSATSANFNGGVAIGYYIPPFTPPVTFNPGPLATWTIAENLTIGDESGVALAVSNATWDVGGDLIVGGNSGSLTIQSGGTMTVGGNLDIRTNGVVSVEAGATLDVTNDVFIAKTGKMTYKSDRAAEDTTYEVRGGSTGIFCPPMGGQCVLTFTPGGSLSFEDTANAADATINVEGGEGDSAPPGQVIFRGNASAGDASPAQAEFRTKGGRRGPSLSGELDGDGGQVIFQNTSTAGDAIFINEGISDWYGGTGGRTIFTNNSTADRATINNHGATTAVAFLGPVMAGATHFYDFSTAGTANITNHTDGAYSGAFFMSAQTVFFDSSDAGNATIENEGATAQTVNHGRTEFRGNSSAALSNIHNRAHMTPGGAAGRTIFYDSATAADATIHTYDGYSDHGRIEFRNQSTAARARIMIDNDPLNTASAGGYLNFFDNSTAAQSQIFLRPGTQGTVQFYNNATAADAQIITETGVGNPGNIIFNDNSTAANANISLGESSNLTFYGQSTAANATITMANRAKIDFQGTSAGQAQIVAAGGSMNTGGVQAFINFLGASATAANSTITVNGATATLASPALVQITGGASPGNATLIANGGANGGAGGTILFNGAANGSTARIIANAGSLVNFFSQAIYNDISFGSIEGAGTFWLRGAHVITGSRNTSTTVSGPIVDTLVAPTYTGGRLTKVGTGTLTLAGTNTYSGLTTINSGAVSVTGSITGGAVVNSGGTLNGTGTIAGGVTVNGSGVFNPGLSPGTITIGGLTMNSGSTLNCELGDPLRDHIVLTNNGNVSLAGILNVSLLGGFTPTLGQSFPLFEGAIGSITGAFDTIIAPTFNGLTFDVVQSATSFLLQVGNAPFLAGDYNGNGVVDTADFTVWRDYLGSSSALLNDDTPGVEQDDYDRWKSHFGAVSLGIGSGGGSAYFASGESPRVKSAVPEPSSFAILTAGAVVAVMRLMRRRTRSGLGA